MTARPVLKANPEICPGCYDLHLYCRYDNPQHGWDEFPHSVTQAQTYREAARIAKSLGWILHRDGTATCPKCAAAMSAA